ncbi:MAG: 50S ribosomal protein L5 [Patescibacteria group bacterium]
MATLKEKYDKEIAPALKKELGRKSTMAVPRVQSISVSSGIGSMVVAGLKDYEFIEQNLAAITGQKPALRKARMAISNFKLRAGIPVGLVVTLRGKRMYDFLSRFLNIALPRVRDFRGISVKSLDDTGNYSVGLKDSTIFPEVKLDTLTKNFGLQINVKTTAKNKKEAYSLLKSLGFPFRDEITS